jgi:hypothetical protein
MAVNRPLPLMKIAARAMTGSKRKRVRRDGRKWALARDATRERNRPGRRGEPPIGAVEPWKNFQLETSAVAESERSSEMIPAVIERCAGIDAGKKVLCRQRDGGPGKTRLRYDRCS